MFNVNNKDTFLLQNIYFCHLSLLLPQLFFHFRNLFLNFQLFFTSAIFFFFYQLSFTSTNVFFFTSGNFFFTSNFLFHFQLFLLTQTFFYFNCGTYQCHFYPKFTILLRFSYYTISPNMGIQGA